MIKQIVHCDFCCEDVVVRFNKSTEQITEFTQKEEYVGSCPECGTDLDYME